MDAGLHRAQEAMSRREALRLGAALGTALSGLGAAAAPGVPVPGAPTELERSVRRYPNKKSINLWAFPYPQRMTLKQCFALAKRAGFDAVELNYDLESDLSPKASQAEVRDLGEAARAAGREAVAKLLPQAEKLRVHLNIENIFFNGYLMSPPELIEFVDSFKSPYLKVHFDTGNIMPFQFPEHWIPLLGKRIQNVHLKEYSKKGTDFSIESFRPLLDGTTDWPKVLEAFDA